MRYFCPGPPSGAVFLLGNATNEQPREHDEVQTFQGPTDVLFFNVLFFVVFFIFFFHHHLDRVLTVRVWIAVHTKQRNAESGHHDEYGQTQNA